MQRWDYERMLTLAQQLFAKLHKRKRFSNPNHDIHHLARNSEEQRADFLQFRNSMSRTFTNVSSCTNIS
jgi:hypothetical protein